MENINVITNGGDLSQGEINAYIKHGKEQYPFREITSLEINLDGDCVDLKYGFKPVEPFQRIRRITGYLVGTTDRWNNAKKAEEKDRVKHSVVVE